MEPVLLSLLETLDAIGKDHAELYDSEVRNQMGGAVFSGFLQRKNGYVLPDSFGLYSDEGNRKVKAALASFNQAANARAQELGLNDFHSRLAAFQNSDVSTSGEGNYHDDFFGWWNPDDFDAAG